MALPHDSKVYAFKQAQITKMLTDPAGGVATYAAQSVKLTGAKKLMLGGSIKVVYLRGDNRLLDSDAVMESLTGQIDHAKLNLDALATLWSTAVVDSGVTPNQLASWAMLSTDSLNYWKFEGRSAGADPLSGDFDIVLWKCKLAGIPSIGFNEEDYQLTNIPFVSLPRISDNAWMNIVERESAAVIP